MRTLRYFLAPVVGALAGFLVNLALIKALALVMVALGPLGAAKLTQRMEMLTEQMVIFLLCGLAAGAVAGQISGRAVGRALGMQAGLLAWMMHWGYAMWQGAAEQIAQAPGVAAVIYASALGSVLAGGYVGARLATRRRRRRVSAAEK
jgi:hypothetical protein